MAGGQVLCTPAAQGPSSSETKDKGLATASPEGQRDVPALRDRGMCHPGLAAASQQNEAARGSSPGSSWAGRHREQGWGNLRAGSLSGTRFSVDAITCRKRPGHAQDEQDNTEIAFGSETSHGTPRASKVGSRSREANPFLNRSMGRKLRATLLFC